MCKQAISQEHIIWEQNLSKGGYKPAFMQIHLHESFDGDLDKLDIPTLGVFVHEYIHFLQNLSTPWGLYDSMVRYNIMAETYAYVEKTTGSITLPLKIEYSKKLNDKIKIVENGTGYCPLADTRRQYFEIDKNEKIHIHRNVKKIEHYSCPIITLDISYTDKSKQTITLGANIIKESMAALYQQLIDDTVTHERFDLPYNLVKILAEQNYPAIANDNVKLITICYISLFSLSPAEVLMDQLYHANENPSLSAAELFEHFMEKSKMKVKGRKKTISDFFDNLITTFKEVFSRSIKVDIDYINTVLDKIRPANGFIPILTVITDYQPLSIDRIKTLIDFLGVPYTYTDNGDFNPPITPSTESDELSKDMLALIGHNVLFTYLTELNKFGRICPMHSFCEKQESDKDECYDKPWNGKECPMTIMSKIISLDKKEIIFNP